MVLRVSPNVSTGQLFICILIPYNKETGEFHSQSRFINYDETNSKDVQLLVDHSKDVALLSLIVIVLQSSSLYLFGCVLF